MLLIIGGVLKARSLRDLAQAGVLAREMRDVREMVRTYQERYKATPGDDPAASLHFRADVTNGDGDGWITNLIVWPTNWLTPSRSSDESILFWNHVRLAGLAEGNPNRGEALNAMNGQLRVVSFTSANIPRKPAGSRAIRHVVCSGKIPGKIAKIMDQEMDDGNATQGIVWASAEANGEEIYANVFSPVFATPYTSHASFTVCMGF
ncbi:hypothetical protein LE190_14355 [Massilia oculi]|uniref:Prepilin-type cleavage/methylation domain-containing protein n=1 Tax=Massilia hydrophila TaxID=3044279 RepID=A0ABS7YBN7_9BURK|nr:hypothetical protein [Massilia oculi]MCA1857100.1 hypothetical protein [Massilia oculi]